MSAFVISTVALSVAVHVGLFAVVNGVLYKAHPLSATLKRLVPIQPAQNGTVLEDALVTPEYLSVLLAEPPRAVSRLASFRGFQANVSVGHEHLMAQGEVVAGDYFGLLGIRPIAGRLLNRSDSSAAAAPVAVVSERMWREQLAGTLDLTDAVVAIDRTRFQVVGVAPREFPGMFAWSVASRDVWVARPYARAVGVRENGTTFAELAAGASVAQLRAELASIRVDDHFSPPHTMTAGWGTLNDLIERRPPQMAAVAWLGVGLAGVVYAVGLGNLLLLVAVRVEARTGEFLLRLALGAGPQRIIRLVAAEALVLVFSGGLVGVVGAAWALPWVFGAFAVEAGGVMPRVDLNVDWRVVLYAAVVLALTAIGFSRVLAARVIALDGQEAALLGHARIAPGWRTLRGRTLAVQLAFATALVTVAVVFARGAHSAVASAEVGLASNTVVGWHNTTTGTTLASITSSFAFLPVTDRISVGNALPGAAPRTQVTLADGSQVRARCIGVGEGFFETLGVGLVEGRALRADDGEHGVVISQALGRALSSNGGALGREVELSDCLGARFVRVVGVVADTAVAIDAGAGRTVYVPLGREAPRTVAVFLRGPLPADITTRYIEAALRNSGRTGELYDLSPLSQQIAGVQGPQEAAQRLIRTLALIAVLMAVIGVVGVALQVTVDARREFAIRRVLGATRLSICRTVIRGLLSWELCGAVVIGLAAAFVACSLLQSWVRYLPSFDWQSGVIVAAGGVIVVLVAVAVPVFWRLRQYRTSLLRDLA